ncbi:hypothetical protein [Actinophytocola sp.]|uniref:hypothetical protein n=1 Tax=Actinophytocola sp. TaxID=1872138 RepID=UPI002ED06B70
MTSGSGPLFLGPDVAASDAVALVAQPSQPNEPGGEGADFGKSSPVGLLVLLLFFIAVAFLVRSMTKHLKRVPASFDPPAESPAEPAEKASDDDKK